MRRVPFELAFLATIDLLIGGAYLLLDSSYFTGRGLRIPKGWLPLPGWGVLYLIVAIAVLVPEQLVRRLGLIAGAGVNVAFGLGLLAAFATGIHSPAHHSSPVGGLLLLGWAVRHYLTGRSST